MNLAIGVDTSCYTTSVALFAADGSLVADARRMLAVKPGAKGLAQSEMVFQHTRNLPELFAQAMARVPGKPSLKAVGATVRPRPLPESYMPAFLVGAGYGKVVALTHGIPFYSLSHQENHILAGQWSAGGPSDDRFLAVHVSGGTTEVTAVSQAGGGLKIDLLGGSQDIAAGQLIDRIGVTLALPFPAGSHLEQLAAAGRDAPAPIPLAVAGTKLSFTGPETHARRLLNNGESPAAVAAGIEICVADSLSRILETIMTTTDLRTILLVGGVMANRHIRERLTERLEQGGGARLFFPAAEYSGDNALGVARFALKG